MEPVQKDKPGICIDTHGEVFFDPGDLVEINGKIYSMTVRVGENRYIGYYVCDSATLGDVSQHCN